MHRLAQHQVQVHDLPSGLRGDTPVEGVGLELREVPPGRVIMGEAQQAPKGEDHAVVVRQAGVSALLHLCRGGAEAPQKLPLGVKAAHRGDRQLRRPPAAPVRHAVVRRMKNSYDAHLTMPSELSC